MLLLPGLAGIFLSIRDAPAQATCSANPPVANDLIKVDAVPSGGVLHLLAYTRQPFGGIAITTMRRFRTDSYTARRTITAGPAFVVTATGDATVRAGERITLRPGVAVRAGGRFRTEIDPSLRP